MASVAAAVALSTPAAGTRDVRRSPKLSCAMPVLEEPTGHTLEMVPSFERLHAPDHGLQIDQGTIAHGTAQRRCRNLRVLRHRCRSHQARSATLAGCGGVLTHAGEGSNRLAGLTAEKSRAFNGRGVPLRASRCPSVVTHTTKLSPCDLPVSVVPARRTAVDFGFYCLLTGNNRAFSSGRLARFRQTSQRVRLEALTTDAGVVKLADAPDSKSGGVYPP